VSSSLGLVAFDLVEGTDIGMYRARQDEIASMLEVRLKPYSKLKTGRSLKFDINVITFAPAVNHVPANEAPYYISNESALAATLDTFEWSNTEDVFKNLIAAIQVVTSIRAGRQKRELKKEDSRGARLKRVEDSIANLDQRQSQAVIETVEGVQRIRGLAGSGKTIVLALKVAYLHAQNPEWRIAVTFNTRSLKEQFRRLINTFTIDQTGMEPDWENIEIINAWGGPGNKARDGIYHQFCRVHDVTFYDFASAKAKFGDKNELAGACKDALEAAISIQPSYDLILVDEAQDLPPSFMRLCYRFLTSPGRLVYAYDELQSLTGTPVQPPEVLFGKDSGGNPNVRLNIEEGGPRQDIILEKCYRNSRPLLATAHALGFGIYRRKGLVQFFDENSLWTDVGYYVEEGSLGPGVDVVLSRTPDSSPEFLENHSSIDDLIQFHKFSGADDQLNWLVNAISDDIHEQELRPEDIVVINPDPISTKRVVGPARNLLFEIDINSELAGVSTSADIFTKVDSVTFTGIFRAKGNEAGMVYIVNAQDCASGWDKAATAIVRNRLFTAITRSKAWVRILGIGPQMDDLIQEWEALKSNDYKLKFTLPTEEEKKQLWLINKEVQGKSSKRRRVIEAQREQIIQAAERGDVDVDQLILDLRNLGNNRPEE